MADKSFFNTPGSAFAVSFIKYEDHGLLAGCWYRYAVGTDPVVLRGEKDADGNFRPNVIYEVATEGKTTWRTIDAKGGQSALETVTISPNDPVTRLWVDMEPFRKTIGMFRYGRLVLENGDAAIFAIEDLLPTADAKGNTGDFNQIVFETPEGKKARGFEDAWIAAPAELFAVISYGDRLIGDFISQAPPGKAVSLQGTKTLDGDFWPKVIFQVADSDHIWKTIGESQNNGTSMTLQIPRGKAERVRVALTDFKPLIGRFKYGKIVFSNEQTGIFAIDLLNPN